MPGPPPKSPETRRRRNAGPAETLLPKAGRSGQPPKWPLEGSPSSAEASLWRDLWATPQAVPWLQLGWTRIVARYCRLTVESEKRDAPASLLAEVRQLEDRLGLTPMAMRRLMWKIDDRDETGAKRDERRAASPARQRFRVVDDAVAGS